MLDSLLAGVMLFSSFAVRTPNVQPNPDDYEVSIGASHPAYYFNRQWERELGTKYIDDLVWVKIENHVYLRRITLIVEKNMIKKAFFPVLSVHNHVNELLQWLRIN